MDSMNSMQTKFNEVQEYDSIYSSINNKEDLPKSQLDTSQKQDEAMLSAHVDSFFLPGGIFELEEDKLDYDSSKPPQDLYPKNDDYYSPVIRRPVVTYDYNQCQVSSHTSTRLDSLDKRINSYHLATDMGVRRNNLNAISEHPPVIFETRQPHIPHRLDYFQQNMDITVPIDTVSGSARSNKYSGQNAYIPTDSNNSSFHHLMTRNYQDISNTSYLASSLLSTQAGQHPIISGEEGRLYPSLPYQSNNRRDYGSPTITHDNPISYSTIHSAPSNNSVFIPPNPWRNHSVKQLSSSMQTVNALGQTFQYTGHSTGDNSEFFPSPAQMTSHHPILYTDPRIHGSNLIYNIPTDHEEYKSAHPSWQSPPSHLPFAGADMRNQISNITLNMGKDQPEHSLSHPTARLTNTQVPITLPERRNQQNISYNMTPGTFATTTNMSITTSTPPGFTGFPPTQPYIQSTSLTSANDASFPYDVTPLLVRKINSFHALDAHDTNNVIAINEQGLDTTRVATQPSQQSIYRSEQDTRNRRERDLDSYSSRGGVPSTIYFRTDDEDGFSFSEDTLTACADSIAENDREYLRRAALNRKDRNIYTENVEQIIENEGYNHKLGSRTSRQNVDNARENNDANKIDIAFNDEDEINYAPDRLNGNGSACINSSIDEPLKKQKRKKKKVKKMSTESLSSKDLSNDNLTNIKESITSQIDGNAEKPQGMKDILSENRGTLSESKEKLRCTKGNKIKVSPSPQYLARQQKAYFLAEDSSSVPKGSAEQKSLIDVYSRHSRTVLLPLLENLLNVSYSFSISLVHVIVQASTLLLPSWDRLWFILPVFCFISDICFFFLCAISSFTGTVSYIVLVSHKMTVLEISENVSAVLCYSLSSLFPIITRQVLKLLPSLPSGSILVLWYTIVRVLLSPMEINHTFLSRIRIRLELDRRSAKNMRISARRQRLFTSIASDIAIEESERFQLTNQFLSTLRHMVPLFVLIECLSTGYGFIVVMSLSERILLGFGLSVIRMGYIFVPIVFISWTVQLILILLFPNRSWQIYSLIVIGFSTIRLSHYVSAIEDMKTKYLKDSFF